MVGIMGTIYFDHAATSPVHPDVVKTMSTVLADTFGNPSSIHSYGRKARFVIDEARHTIAKSIGAQFSEVIFTSGGTEADNLAITGIAHAKKNQGKHIITTTIEHHAGLHTCQHLEKEGFEVTYLQPDETGLIHVDDVKAALRADTILVTIMFGNNEVGTLQPIKEIGQVLVEHQAYFHTDAVQAYGVKEMNVNELNIDLLSLSAHKINGPKGVGCLYVRKGTLIQPLTVGGEQELKRRAGTENVASIAGFAKAVQIAIATMEERVRFYDQLVDRFIQELEAKKIDFHINGTREQSLPHILNISFPGKDVESFLTNLDMAGIAASSGSACTAGSLEPSHVLSAMFGKESERTRNSIRFSFGLGNTLEQVAQATTKIAKIVHKVQK